MNVNSNNEYPVSSDDDINPNETDAEDDGSFFDEVVDDDEEGSYIEEEEEEYSDEGSAQLDNNNNRDENNDEGSYVDEEGSYIDEEGSFVDEEGSYLDEEGSYVDEEGSYVDEEGSFVDEEEYENGSFNEGDKVQNDVNNVVVDDNDDGSYVEEEVIEDGDVDDEDDDDAYGTATPTVASSNSAIRYHDNFHEDTETNLQNNYHPPVRQTQQPRVPFRSVTPSEEVEGMSNNIDDERYFISKNSGTDDEPQYTDEDLVGHDVSNSQSDHGDIEDDDDISDSDERHSIVTTTTDAHQQQQVQKQLQYHELANTEFLSGESNEALFFNDEPNESQTLERVAYHSYVDHDDADVEQRQDMDKAYNDYDDGHSSFESGMSGEKSDESGSSQYDDNDIDQHETQSYNENSIGQQSYASGSSNRYDEADDNPSSYVNDSKQKQQPHYNGHNETTRPFEDGEEDYDNDNDAKSYDSRLSQQYDEEGDDDYDHGDYDQPNDDYDERSNDYDGDDRSFSDGNAYDDHPQHPHDDNDVGDDYDDDDDDDQHIDDDGEASYASSGVSNEDGEQSYIDDQQSYDDEDEQQSYASGMSEGGEKEHDYNPSDDDFDDNEYDSDDGQGSYQSQISDHDSPQPNQDIAGVNNPVVSKSNRSYNPDQPEQHGSSDDENDSYQSDARDMDPIYDDVHSYSNETLDYIQNQRDENQYENNHDNMRTYDPSRTNDRVQQTDYSDDEEEEDDGSYVSEDESQQFDDEEYGENHDRQQYVDEEEDDATFLSAMIGPPPFVEDDTITEEYAETDNEDNVVEEHGRQYLISDDEDDDADNAFYFGETSESKRSDDNELDDAEWSDQSTSTRSHSQDGSTSHKSPRNKASITSKEDVPDTSTVFNIDPPSYHTLQSEKPIEKSSSSNSIAHVAASKSPALLNVGVGNDFSGYTSKTPSLVTKDSIASRGASSHSRKSFDDKTRSSVASSSKVDSNLKADELFIVNTSNRGAQSKIFYNQQRQLSGDFSMDTLQFDMDYDSKVDLDVGNELSSDDPANHVQNGSTTNTATPKDRGVVRNDSTDSGNFFRETNKYINADNSDPVKSESVRSNRTYLSGSNHASAKFESSDEKRYTFVGSDEDSGSLDLDDDGFEHETSDHTPESNEMPSVSTDAKSSDAKTAKKQYNILREVALEFVSSDQTKNGSSDVVSLKSTSSKSSFIEKTSTDSKQPASLAFTNDKPENGYEPSLLTSEYQVYNCSIDNATNINDNNADLDFAGIESIDNHPMMLTSNKVAYADAAPTLSTFRTMDSGVVNGIEDRKMNLSDSSSSSSSPELSSVSEEISYQSRSSKIIDREKAIVTTYQTSNSDIERTNHTANVQSNYPSSTVSNVDDEPNLTHPWIPTNDRKPVTPLLTKTLPASDAVDVNNIEDIESGVYGREEQAPTYDEIATSKKKNKKARKKRPKWMYGTVGIVFLFVFMLTLVLLAKRTKDSSSHGLPPISAPEVAPTSSPVLGQVPSPPSPLLTAGPSSDLMMFILEATLVGSSGNAYGFGSSVAMNDEVIVVGEPGMETVASFNLQGEEWLQGSSVTVDKLNSQFGRALDLANRTIVVGAPFVTTDTNATDGVYVYSHDPLQQAWQQIGATLLGESNMVSDNEEGFGSAVAVSYDFQVVVGAPQNSRNNENAGRVYTFQYLESSASWVSNELFALVGQGADDMFGTSVAISRDGTRFVAGAPGISTPGYARIYYWIDTRWQLLSVLSGENENENCGSSVVMLSDFGDHIAIGCPGFNNGAGRVAVYQQQLSTGRYEQIGPNIVGEEGDGIGYNNGITGDMNVNGPIVIFATANGKVVRHDYDSMSGEWLVLYSPISVPLGNQASLAFTTGQVVDTLVIGLSGSSNQTLIYTVASSNTIPSALTTLVPTAAPLSGSNVPSASFVSSPIVMSGTSMTPTAQEQPELTFAPFPDIVTTVAPVVPETMLPTSPLQVTVPSPITTTSPINTDNLWNFAGGPFQISTDGTSANSSNSSMPISSIAISDTRMVMGSSTVGVVQSFLHQTITIIAIWETKSYQNLYSGNGDISDEYGAAIDMMDDLLIVGAPGGSGTVYCYSVDATTGDWALFGSIIQSSVSQQDRFGSAVSISVGSTVPRMAVGAPNYNNEDGTLLQLGRVSLYEFDTITMDWVRNANDIVGAVSNERFGTALDICASGNFIVIGGPGGGDSSTGTATIYQYSTLDWYAVTTIVGEYSNEEFGSSVHMLSDDGFIVAIGGPNYDTNRGRIVVYERNALTGKYELAGVPIIGEMNEYIGLPNALSGSSNLSKTIFKIIVETANGYVKLYEYNKSSSSASWTSTVIAITDSPKMNTIVTATTSDLSSIVVTSTGNNGVATIYNEYE